MPQIYDEFMGFLKGVGTRGDGSDCWTPKNIPSHLISMASGAVVSTDYDGLGFFLNMIREYKKKSSKIEQFGTTYDLFSFISVFFF